MADQPLVPIMLPPDPVVADFLESVGHMDAAMRLRGVLPEPTRKVLISPGFGAGWSTWSHDGLEARRFMLTYQPIIDFLDGGGAFTGPYDEHPVLAEFAAKYAELFGDPPYLGGARELEVQTVRGLIRVTEYDGSESVQELSDEWI